MGRLARLLGGGIPIHAVLAAAVVAAALAASEIPIGASVCLACVVGLAVTWAIDARQVARSRTLSCGAEPVDLAGPHT